MRDWDEIRQRYRARNQKKSVRKNMKMRILCFLSFSLPSTTISPHLRCTHGWDFGTSFHQNIYRTLLYTPAIRRFHEIQANAHPRPHKCRKPFFSSLFNHAMYNTLVHSFCSLAVYCSWLRFLVVRRFCPGSIMCGFGNHFLAFVTGWPHGWGVGLADCG